MSHDANATELRPDAHLRWVADAQTRFDAAIERLDDDATKSPSLLPGWTVGHVLAHVARNADSHTRRSHGAVRGQVVDQYVGGYEGRAAEIDQGASGTARELIEDVRTSAELLAATWSVLPDPVWTSEVSDVAGRVHLLSQMPARRWRELEIHLVDLEIGPTWRDWPSDFVTENLPILRRTLHTRLPGGTRPPELDERDELAWLCGRLRRPDFPELLPWD